MRYIIMLLFLSACSYKIEYVPVKNYCPKLQVIKTEQANRLHETDAEATERLYKNTRLLMASLGCDYSDSKLWEK